MFSLARSNAFQAVLVVEVPSIATPFAAVVPISVISHVTLSTSRASHAVLEALETRPRALTFATLRPTTSYCAYKLYKVGRASTSQVASDAEGGAEGGAPARVEYEKRLRSWKVSIALMSGCLLVAAALLGLGSELIGAAAPWLATVCIFPVYALNISFNVSIDAFFIEHEERRPLQASVHPLPLALVLYVLPPAPASCDRQCVASLCSFTVPCFLPRALEPLTLIEGQRMLLLNGV